MSYTSRKTTYDVFVLQQVVAYLHVQIICDLVSLIMAVRGGLQLKLDRTGVGESSSSRILSNQLEVAINAVVLVIPLILDAGLGGYGADVSVAQLFLCVLGRRCPNPPQPREL